MNKTRFPVFILIFCMLLSLIPSFGSRAAGTVAMHRIYNPVTMEHLHTRDTNEVYVHTTFNGWQYEGTSWTAPEKSNTPVYRLFCTVNGEHFYTKDANERRHLLANGPWNDEGIGWYSDDAKGVPVYRLYNAAAGIGAHHYTTDAYERSVLIANGWTDEGIAWYGVKAQAAQNTDSGSSNSGNNNNTQSGTDTHTHSWGNGSFTNVPSCTQEGKRVYFCSVCGEKKVEVVAKTEHLWNDGVVTAAASCGKEGVKTYTCIACGMKKTESIPALEHDWQTTREVERYWADVCDDCGCDLNKLYKESGISEWGSFLSAHHAADKKIADEKGTFVYWGWRMGWYYTGYDRVYHTCRNCNEEYYVLEPTQTPVKFYRLETVDGGSICGWMTQKEIDRCVNEFGDTILPSLIY